VIVVSPRGAVDFSNSPALRGALLSARQKQPHRLIVDLSEVSYMDTSGVATLVEALGATSKSRSELLLCGVQQRVGAMLGIARVENMFAIVDTLEGALETFGRVAMN